MLWFWLWLQRLFTRKAQELYVDPMQGETSIDELHAQAELEDRQRTKAQNLKDEGKSILMGYKVPEPLVEDRISVHAALQGWIPPSEKKRRSQQARNRLLTQLRQGRPI